MSISSSSSGVTLTITALFSDGSSATGVVTVP